MSNFKFPATLTTSERGQSVTAFNVNSSHPVYQADSTHPHFDEIVEGLRAGDENVWDLFDVAKGIMSAFSQITDRVSWDGVNVLWDGDPVHSTLAEQLSRTIQNGKSEDFRALALFWEKLESNPNEHSREQAYRWLATHAFQITPDGDVVGYKGVVDNGDGTYRSTAASQATNVPSAYVNGRPLPPNGFVTQKVGDVVTMPRSEVVHDPSQSCSRGLHVATRRYAKSYGTVMEVHVNPRDFCSVPNGEDEKVRVCRYKVARIDSGDTGNSPVLRNTENTWAGDVGYKV